MYTEYSVIEIFYKCSEIEEKTILYVQSIFLKNRSRKLFI